MTWNKIGSGDRYVVFRKTPGSGWTRLATLTDKNITSYTDKHPVLGKTNTYTVRSYYSKTKVYGNYNSKGVSVNVPKPVVPGQPKLKKATAESYDRVKLTWNKASNATAYRIYYKTNGGSWKSAGDVDANTTSFIHSGLKENTRYTYTVKAYNKNSKKWGSYDKKGLTVTTPKIATPSQPKLKSISAPAHDKVKITWGKSSNAEGYCIYYRKLGGPWVEVTYVDANTTSYVCDGLDADTSYTFTVRAFNHSKWSTYDKHGLTVRTPKLPSGEIKVYHVELDRDFIYMNVGESYTLNATVYPANATNKKLKWESADTSIATVDSNGRVSGVGEGTTMVYARATDGSGQVASCEVDVYAPATPTPTPDKKYTVTFDSQGGSHVSSQTVKEGTTISFPTPTRDGYKFLGWYTEADGGNKVTSLTVTKNVTLYAHWEKEQGSVVENIVIAGGDSGRAGIMYSEHPIITSPDKIEIEYQSPNEVFSVAGIDKSKRYLRIDIEGLRKGTASIIARYEGKVIKRFNVTVTSDWTEYLEYVSWRKGVEAQIWNNSMSVTQKLDAAENYIKTNFEYTYEEGASIITAYKTKKVDCLGASELFGHMAQDLNLRVGYVRASTGEIYDYIGEAIGGHVYNAVMLNGKWEFYDAQPPH
nr:InlB B-repeat-containing protein [uncultured Blautia sp.]